MENLLKSLMSVDEGSFNKPIPGTHKLGIHFTPSAITLLAVKMEKHEVQAFQQYGFDGTKLEFNQSTITALLDYFRNKHPWFSDPTINITVLLPGRGFTLVPNEVYDSFNKEQFLEPQYHVQQGDIVFSERLISTDITAVYALNWDWNQQLNSYFSNVKLLHEDLCWLNLAFSPGDKFLHNNTAIVLLEEDRIKIQLVDNQKLQYYNSFSFQQLDDILYYLQLSASQFGLITANLNVFLAGPAAEKEGLQNFLSPYFASVNQLKPHFFNSLPTVLKKNHPTLFIPLLSMLTCV